jgi:soluble lytic murein transglycosylase-like protein
MRADSAPPSEISAVFTPEVQHWADDIARWASRAGLDPNLLAAVMQIESCGDPRATSRAGAIGLFQVMPFHFAVTDLPYAPETNAARATDYLSRALSAAEGNPPLALAGYNGGLSVIGRAEWAWPAETVRYVYWGTGIYDDARRGAGASPRLDEWLAAGGSGLCRQARGHLHLTD